MNLSQKIKMSAIIAGMMICFAAPAYGADLKLNVDALIKARDAKVNSINNNYMEQDIYICTPAEAFEGANGNITLGDIYRCMAKYGTPQGAYWEMNGYDYESIGYFVDNLYVLASPGYCINWDDGSWDKWENNRIDEISIQPNYAVIIQLNPYIDFNTYYASGQIPDFSVMDQMVEKVSYLNHGGEIAPKIGWQHEADGWFYYKTEGIRYKGWLQTKDGYYYMDMSDGSRSKGFKEIDSKWYYFSPETYLMQTGWQKINYKGYDSWFYFTDGGRMLKGGPHSIDGSLYHFEDDGTMTWGQVATGNDGILRFYTNEGPMLYGEGEGVKVTDRTDGREYIVKGSVATPAVPSFQDRVYEFVSHYEIGTYWQNNGVNNPDGTIPTPSTIDNSFDGSSQCNGFAKYFFFKVFGEMPSSRPTFDDARTTDIKVGDYVRLNEGDTHSYLGDHSIFVTNIEESNGVTYIISERAAWGSGNVKNIRDTKHNAQIVKERYSIDDEYCLTLVSSTSNAGERSGNMKYNMNCIRRASEEARRIPGLN